MAKKRSSKFKRKLIGLISLVIIIAAIISIAQNVIAYEQLKTQKLLVEKELELLLEENENLSDTKSKLEDENYVQTYARGEYMFSKEDEKVFYLPSKGK